MEDSLTTTELDAGLRLAELWIEFKTECPKGPSRSQFYEWLKATWCIPRQSRGGFKTAQRFKQIHLNRLIKFYEFKQGRSLQSARDLLIEEMERNPNPYLEAN